VLDAADEALSEKLSRLCFEGPESALKLTANTQPALLAISVATCEVFRRRAGEVAMMAGHSLGEYSALVAAGAMPLADAVRAVRARGIFMQEAVPPGTGAMAAVLGLSPEKVLEACQKAAGDQVLSPANYNAPEQTVIAGHAEAVKRAEPFLLEAGARKVVSLPVSAPFHCALMEPVKPRLREVLERISFRAPSVPVVSNVEAAPNRDPSRILPLLVDQVTHPVRWVECVQAMDRAGVKRVVELGPGKVLCGLVKRIARGIELFNVESAATLEKVLAATGG